MPKNVYNYNRLCVQKIEIKGNRKAINENFCF